MKLVLEIRRHADDEQATHHTAGKFPLTLGRGYHNDIILSDPYVSDRHLSVEYDGENIFVIDHNSENGMIVDAIPRAGQRRAVVPGSIVRIGQTDIRIYTPASPVPAALPLQKDNPLFFWFSRPLAVWGSFLLALAVTLGWAWLEVWTEEPGMLLSGIGAGMVGTVVLWSALWSVAGRLTRRKPHFRSHGVMICFYMIAGTLEWYIESYVDFWTNENWIAQLTTYSLNFILLSFLIYGSLTLATSMSHARRRMAAGFFSLGLVAGVFALSLISAKSFNQQPLYPATLEPYLSRLAPTQTAEEFMKGNAELITAQKSETIKDTDD